MNGICDLELPKNNKMNSCHFCELLVLLLLSLLAFIFYMNELDKYRAHYYYFLTFASLLVYFIGFVLSIWGISCQDKNKVIWGFKSFFLGCIFLFFYFILFLNDVENAKVIIISFLLIIGIILCALLIQLRNSSRSINVNELNR